VPKPLSRNGFSTQPGDFDPATRPFGEKKPALGIDLSTGLCVVLSGVAVESSLVGLFGLNIASKD
jgi:hypothetical protein